MFFDLCQRQKALDETAIACGGRILTFSELYTRVRQVAQFLLEQGVTPQARVIVILNRSEYHPILLIALNLIRAIYVPLNINECKTDPTRVKDIFSNILDDAEHKSMQVCLLMQSQDELKTYNQLSTLVQDSHINMINLGQFDPDTADEVDETKIDEFRDQRDKCPDDIVYIAHSSGTTGLPKGIPITRLGNEYWHHLLSQAYDNFGDCTGFVETMPVDFDACVYNYLQFLTAAKPLYVATEHEHKVPSRLSMLIQSAGVSDALLSASFVMHETFPKVDRLKRVSLTGKKITKEIVKRCHDLGYDVISLYGQTERTYGDGFYVIRQGESAPIEINIDDEMQSFYPIFDLATFPMSNIDNRSLPSSVKLYLYPDEVEKGQQYNPDKLILLNPSELLQQSSGSVSSESDPIKHTILSGELLIESDHTMSAYLNNPKASANAFVEVKLKGKVCRLFRTRDWIHVKGNQLLFEKRLGKDQKINYRWINFEKVQVAVAEQLAIASESVFVLKVPHTFRDDSQHDYLAVLVHSEKTLDENAISLLNKALLGKLNARDMPHIISSIDTIPEKNGRPNHKALQTIAAAKVSERLLASALYLQQLDDDYDDARARVVDVLTQVGSLLGRVLPLEDEVYIKENTIGTWLNRSIDIMRCKSLVQGELPIKISINMLYDLKLVQLLDELEAKMKMNVLASKLGTFKRHSKELDKFLPKSGSDNDTSDERLGVFFLPPATGTTQEYHSLVDSRECQSAFDLTHVMIYEPTNFSPEQRLPLGELTMRQYARNIASNIHKLTKSNSGDTSKPEPLRVSEFAIVGWSFGGDLAAAVAYELRDLVPNKTVRVLMLDSQAPLVLNQMTATERFKRVLQMTRHVVNTFLTSKQVAAEHTNKFCQWLNSDAVFFDIDEDDFLEQLKALQTRVESSIDKLLKQVDDVTRLKLIIHHTLQSQWMVYGWEPKQGPILTHTMLLSTGKPILLAQNDENSSDDPPECNLATWQQYASNTFHCLAPLQTADHFTIIQPEIVADYVKDFLSPEFLHRDSSRNDGDDNAPSSTRSVREITSVETKTHIPLSELSEASSEVRQEVLQGAFASPTSAPVAEVAAKTFLEDHEATSLSLTGKVVDFRTLLANRRGEDPDSDDNQPDNNDTAGNQGEHEQSKKAPPSPK